MIAEVALDVVDDDVSSDGGTADEDGLEPARLWNMIGGLNGLETLEANSKVLIDLACYLQRSYPEALPIAEQLRWDSRALQFHVSRLRGAAGTGNLEASFPVLCPARCGHLLCDDPPPSRLVRGYKFCHAARATEVSLKGYSVSRMATNVTRPMLSISLRYLHRLLVAGESG